MDWLELTQQVDEETVEPVVELFNRYCRGGAVVEQRVGTDEGGQPLPVPVTLVRAYLPPADDQVETLLCIQQGLWHLSQISPLPGLAIARLEEQDWADKWKEQFHVLRIGRFVIRPSWREYEPEEGDLVLTLDPGMAFGTGLHPSTALCLRALEDAVEPGMSVLDMGTGSGILAIAAARLGAERVLALDSDPVAVRVASENVHINGFRGVIDVRQGSLPEVSGTYHLIVINILARVIRDMLWEGLASHLRPVGQIIAAGILETQADGVKQAFRAEGLRVVSELREKDWVMLRAETAPL